MRLPCSEYLRNTAMRKGPRRSRTDKTTNVIGPLAVSRPEMPGFTLIKRFLPTLINVSHPMAILVGP
jgi:hypothetical protein